VALKLLGEPTKKTKHEWRYGNKGSLSINIDKGVWTDFENNADGGVLELITYHHSGVDPWQWMRDNQIQIPERKLYYVYPDETRQPLYREVRREREIDGKRIGSHLERYDKDQKRYIAGEGTMEGVRRVLYNLPEIVEAAPGLSEPSLISIR